VISERLSAWLMYTAHRARELGLDIGRSRTRQFTDGVRFERFEWQLPAIDREAIVDSRELIDAALQAWARAQGIVLPPPPVVEPGVARFTDARNRAMQSLLQACPCTVDAPVNIVTRSLGGSAEYGYGITAGPDELAMIAAHFPETVDGVPIYLKPLTEMRTIADIQRRTPNTVTLELPL
jgi:hypothetical protein